MLSRAMEYSPATLVYGLAGAAVLLYLQRWLWPGKHQLAHIPAIGPTMPLVSYWGAVQCMIKGPERLRLGYEKFKGRAFKIATFDRWVVVLTDPDSIKELWRAPESKLSFAESYDGAFQIRVLTSPLIAKGVYVSKVFRNGFTPNLSSFLPAMWEEIEASCHDELRGAEEQASAVSYELVLRTMTQVYKRLLIASPSETMPQTENDRSVSKLLVDYPKSLAIAGIVTRELPKFLKSTIAHLMTGRGKYIKQGTEFWGNEMERRLRLTELHGPDYPGKPCDMLSFLIDHAPQEYRNVNALVQGMLISSGSAIYMTTMTLTHALQYLASEPEYARVLREEVESAVRETGSLHSKQTLDQLHRMDSFLKECLRVHPPASVTLIRIAMEDIMLTDGTYIPEGTLVTAPQCSTSDYYEDGEAFKPWRFSDIRQQGGDSSKLALVNSGIEFLSFGHGQHACPGRFIAAAQCKLLLSRLVTLYDMTLLAGDGAVPPSRSIGLIAIPDLKAKVLFKRRSHGMHGTEKS